MRKSVALGISFPFANMLLQSCTYEEGIDYPNIETNFSGSVLIVGAGAAGLGAGYLLNRLGIEFQIIEASTRIGGRMKRESFFSDFPIDLGAEWIHDSPSVLADIINNQQVDADLDFIVYNPQEIKFFDGEKLINLNLSSNYYSEYKFKNTSWFGFFERFILPDIEDRIVLDSPIQTLDYSGDMVEAITTNDQVFRADKVLVTVPITILQSGSINFIPNLPSSKAEAIDKIFMGDGIKVFMEFSERFYPDLVLFGSVADAIFDDSNKLYYNASFRKDSDRNILGLFSVQEEATTYTSAGSEEQIINLILKELDEIFDNKASKSYVKHVIQNWSGEPYIRGSYSNTFDGDTKKIMKAVSKPIDSKVYFAGEALNYENQATVHGACESGYQAIENILS